jgi:hypothetical protein
VSAFGGRAGFGAPSPRAHEQALEDIDGRYGDVVGLADITWSLG